MIELVLHSALLAQLTKVEQLEIAMHKAVIARLQSLGRTAEFFDIDGGTLFYCGQQSFLTQRNRNWSPAQFRKGRRTNK